MRARRNIAGIRGVSDRRPFRRPNLADAVEIRVVVLPRNILTDQSIAERHILPAEMCVRREIKSRLASRRNHGEHSRRSFLVQITDRIQRNHSLNQIRRGVSLQPVDLRRPRQHRKLGHESWPRSHSARKKLHIGKRGRHPRRHIRRIEQRDPGAENIQRQRRKSFNRHCVSLSRQQKLMGDLGYPVFVKSLLRAAAQQSRGLRIEAYT